MIDSNYLESEKELLLQGEISVQSIRSKLDGMADEDRTGQLEAEISDEFKRCKNLARIFGEAVFKVDDSSKVIRINENFKAKKEHMLCLLAMTTKDEEKKERIGKLFEKIVGKSVQSYLGNSARFINIDPLDKIDFEKFCEEDLFEEHQTKFNEKLEKLPRCDLIAWKPFSNSFDKRPSKLILLIQCKSGKKWRKGHPVNQRSVKEQIINFAAEPIIVYAITDMITKEEMLQYSKEKGMIFDRVRIISQLADVDDDEIKEIRKEIKKIKPEEDLEQ